MDADLGWQVGIADERDHRSLGEGQTLRHGRHGGEDVLGREISDRLGHPSESRPRSAALPAARGYHASAMVGSSALRARLMDEGLEPGAWSNGPGDRYAAHEHGYDKVIVVAAGSIRFGVHDGPLDLAEGDRLELLAGTSHDAVVGGSGVTCLEAHLPAGSLAGTTVRAAGSW